MKSLFVSDLDGTLLDDTHTIPEKNATALKEASNSGHAIAIATGRTWKDAAKLCHDAGLSPWIISSNGASIRRPDGALHLDLSLPAHVTDRMIRFLITENIYFELLFDEYVLSVDALFSELKSEAHEEACPPEDERFHESIIDRQLSQSTWTSVSTKAMMMHTRFGALNILAASFSAEKRERIRNCFKKYDMSIYSSSFENLILSRRDATKGLAVKTLSEHLGISLDHVFAFGDSHNDISMLQMAGKSYAMDNASDAVKSYAKNIAPLNTEFGVAKIIESHLKATSK